MGSVVVCGIFTTKNQKSTNNTTVFTTYANDKANNFVPVKVDESADDSSGFVVGDVLGVVPGADVGDVLVPGDVLGDVLGADVGTPKGNALGKDVIESGTTVEGDDVDILSTCSVIQS